MEQGSIMFSSVCPAGVSSVYSVCSICGFVVAGDISSRMSVCGAS